MFFSKFAVATLATAAMIITTVKADGECCIDDACTVCAEALNEDDGSDGFGTFESCKAQGYPGFLLPGMPADGPSGCMKTSEPKLHYCCPSKVPDEEIGVNPALIFFDGCQNCDSRFTEAECFGSDLPYIFDAYDTRICEPAGPGVIDDPHIKSWNGTFFDYQGECDLVMVHVENFQESGFDLDIHIRTTIRYDYSYISSAVLRIGEDTLEVSSWGAHALNAVESAPLNNNEFTLSGYPIKHTLVNKKQSKFEVAIGKTGEKITLSTFKDMVSVRIAHGSMKHFGSVTGVMGNSEGKLMARDGVTLMTDVNAFAQEWQVTADEPMLFRSVRSPQAANNEKCILPNQTTKSQRRLGESIARDAAEKACSQYSGVNFDNCVYDVMAVGDLELAQAGAY